MRGKIFSALEIVIHFAFLVAMLISSWLSEFIPRGNILIAVGAIVAVTGLVGLITAKRGKFAYARKDVA